MSDRPLSEQVRKARKADVDLGLLGDEIAALEAELAEAKECKSEAERMGETWLRQRQPERYGPDAPTKGGDE